MYRRLRSFRSDQLLEGGGCRKPSRPPDKVRQIAVAFCLCRTTCTHLENIYSIQGIPNDPVQNTPPRPPHETRSSMFFLSPNNNSVSFASYDSFASLRGDRIPPHVKDGREMIDGVAAWALPGTLSLIPVDILVAVVGALMCEYQVRASLQPLGSRGACRMLNSTCR